MSTAVWEKYVLAIQRWRLVNVPPPVIKFSEKSFQPQRVKRAISCGVVQWTSWNPVQRKSCFFYPLFCQFDGVPQPVLPWVATPSFARCDFVYIGGGQAYMKRWMCSWELKGLL